MTQQTDFDSSSSFKKGCIYRTRYRRYKHDKTPLILVLYADKTIVHALNINYLNTEYIDEYIQFLGKYFKIITGRYSAYSFYHKYMKRGVHNVIKKAYRTYKPDAFSSKSKITFNEIQTLSTLESLKVKTGLSRNIALVLQKTKNKNLITQRTKTGRIPKTYLANFVDVLDNLLPKKEYKTTRKRKK